VKKKLKCHQYGTKLETSIQCICLRWLMSYDQPHNGSTIVFYYSECLRRVLRVVEHKQKPKKS